MMIKIVKCTKVFKNNKNSLKMKFQRKNKKMMMKRKNKYKFKKFKINFWKVIFQ